MKVQLTTAAFVLAVAAPVFAQTTGVSQPDATPIATTDDSASQTVSAAEATGASTRRPLVEKPSAAVASPDAGTVYGPYVPYTGAKSVADTRTATAANDLLEEDAPDASSSANVDAQIITSLPDREGELREGTLLKTEINQALSTASTVEGSRFTASVMEPVEKDGKVVIPAGSVLEGRVTQVHGGRRITGAAALHLETSAVTLPDGTHYVVHAQLVDTSRSDFKVTDEGTLKRKDHPKEMLAVASLTTGGAAAAGAVLGGGVGAVVGAGIGAGVSTVIWLKQDRQATLNKNVQLVFSLTTPMILKPLAPVSAAVTGSAGGAQ